MQATVIRKKFGWKIENYRQGSVWDSMGVALSWGANLTHYTYEYSNGYQDICGPDRPH